jgi:hypothetical protein
LDGDGSHPGGLRRLASREVDFRPLLAWVKGHPAGIVLGLGALARVAQYLSGRSYWLDESSLLGNIARPRLADLFGPLWGTQLAPPGFLAVEWALYRLFGDSVYVTRFFPLVCGLAGLWLFAGVARRVLRPSAVLLGLALFASADDLIYFSSELKQYVGDVAAALAVTWVGLDLARRPATPRRLLAFGALGVAAVWFSHPSAFVLAGVGTTLLVSALSRRDWPTFLALGAASLAWLASFAGVHHVAMNQMNHRRDLWAFWASAFPPAPPRTLWDLSWWPRQVLYLFVNPIEFWTPLGWRLSTLPPLACFMLGCVSMGKRDRTALAMLVSPALIAALATCLKLYPFHGRLVLFLVPMLLLLIAEGAGSFLAAYPGRAARAGVLAALLVFPACYAAYDLTSYRDFNPWGDRRPNWLDPTRFPLGPEPPSWKRPAAGRPSVGRLRLATPPGVSEARQGGEPGRREGRGLGVRDPHLEATADV